VCMIYFCMSMYVCVCVCPDVCLFVCLYVCMFCMSVCRYVSMSACLNVWIYVSVWMYVSCMYIFAYAAKRPCFCSYCVDSCSGRGDRTAGRRLLILLLCVYACARLYVCVPSLVLWHCLCVRYELRWVCNIRWNSLGLSMTDTFTTPYWYRSTIYYILRISCLVWVGFVSEYPVWERNFR